MGDVPENNQISGDFAEAGITSFDANAAEFPYNPTPALSPQDQRIYTLQNQLTLMAERLSIVENTHVPTPDYFENIFPAQITGGNTTYTWQEYTNLSGNLTSFTGGRSCTSTSDSSAAKEMSGATHIPTGTFVEMIEIHDATACYYQFKFIGPLPASITAHTGSAGTNTFNPYTASTVTGNVSITGVTNGFEPFDGSPGRLGVNVSSGGVVNGGSCIVQPIGNGAVVSLTWNGSNWTFAAPNSAQ